MKLLVLILSNSHIPLYANLKDLCRSYIPNRTSEFEWYFYEEDPELEVPSKQVGDTLYVRCPFGVEYTTTKLQLALNHFKDRFHEFTHLVRPNLSTFVVWDRLLSRVQKLPTKNMCTSCKSSQPPGTSLPIFGENCSRLQTGLEKENKIAGAAFVVSMDVAEAYRVVRGDTYPSLEVDDCTLQNLVSHLRCTLVPFERLDILHTQNWKYRPDIETEYGSFFQYLKQFDFLCFIRVKHIQETRDVVDIECMKGLIQTFYPDATLPTHI